MTALEAIRALLEASDDERRALLARLAGQGDGEVVDTHIDNHADRTWPPATVDPSDAYWQWGNLANAAAHGPFKATKLYEMQDRISLKVEGRRYYSLTQIWREHRPR